MRNLRIIFIVSICGNMRNLRIALRLEPSENQKLSLFTLSVLRACPVALEDGIGVCGELLEKLLLRKKTTWCGSSGCFLEIL
jgi:hypothetical protein